MIGHMKKDSIIVPIVITIFLIVALIAYGFVWLMVPFPLVVKILIGLVFLSLVGVAVFVMIERIKEIRSDENDDLSEY